VNGAVPLLSVVDVEAGYGESQVLFGISLDVADGEVVTLLGRNGMGKTTTISAIMGILPISRGAVHFEGRQVAGLRSYRIARLGLGLVPEGRQIFPNLTVRENLISTAANRAKHAKPWNLESVLGLFPKLAERLNALGGLLSGGEQQMLAVGRALMTNPKLLILDEATEGLAPMVRADIWQVLERLKAAGQSILVIDKNVGALMRVATRHYVMEKGRVVWSGTSGELRTSPEIRQRYLGI
jgi:branched-chain amino acid transport system ATP-binding protein